MNVHAAVKGAEGTSECGLGKFFAGYDSSGATEEKFKHVELGSGQLDRDTAALRGAGEQRERDVSDGERLITGGVIVNLKRTAKNGADASDEFAGIEGLGNVVVGTDFKAEDAVNGFSASGEQDDRNAGMSPQGLEKLKAGAAGKHDIQDDHVVLAGERRIESGAVIVDGKDLKSLILQEALQEGD
jgi:hypothetical protein